MFASPGTQPFTRAAASEVLSARAATSAVRAPPATQKARSTQAAKPSLYHRHGCCLCPTLKQWTRGESVLVPTNSIAVLGLL